MVILSNFEKMGIGSNLIVAQVKNLVGYFSRIYQYKKSLFLAI